MNNFIVTPDQDNVIRKFASFVAKNGSDFEQLTKENQMGNPLFDFLKPDNHLYQYYMEILTQERNGLTSYNYSYKIEKPVDNFEVEDISQYSEESVIQSQKNLELQKKSFDEMEEIEVEETILRSRRENLLSKCQACDKKIEEMDDIINPLIEACTKENIAKGKNWIMEIMSKTETLSDIMGDYLLYRVCHEDDVFSKKLHIVYLLNDIFHCIKKRGASHHLQKTLNRIVVPIYCNAFKVANESERSKLERVYELWKKNEYLPTIVIDQMSCNYEESLSEYFSNERSIHNVKIREVRQKFSTNYQNLKRQHDEFANFAEGARRSYREKLLLNDQNEISISVTKLITELTSNDFQSWDDGLKKGKRHSRLSNEDSKIRKKTVKTNLPHWLLPAALMNDKIRLCDFDVKKPILDEEFTLFKPHLPSIQLCIALDAYYAPPSHDRPRDADGWEKLALLDFYKKKNVTKTSYDIKIKVAQLKKKNQEEGNENDSIKDEIDVESMFPKDDINLLPYKHILPPQLTADRPSPPSTMASVTAYPPLAISQGAVTGQDALAYHSEWIVNPINSSFSIPSKINNNNNRSNVQAAMPNVFAVENLSLPPPPVVQSNSNIQLPQQSIRNNASKSTTRSGFKRPSSSERSDSSSSRSSRSRSRSNSRSREKRRYSRKKASRSSSSDSRSSRDSRDSNHSRKEYSKSNKRKSRNRKSNSSKFRSRSSTSPNRIGTNSSSVDRRYINNRGSLLPKNNYSQMQDSYYNGSENYYGDQKHEPAERDMYWNSSENYYHMSGAQRSQNYQAFGHQQYYPPHQQPPQPQVNAPVQQPPYYHPKNFNQPYYNQAQQHWPRDHPQQGPYGNNYPQVNHNIRNPSNPNYYRQ